MRGGCNATKDERKKERNWDFLIEQQQHNRSEEMKKVFRGVEVIENTQRYCMVIAVQIHMKYKSLKILSAQRKQLDIILDHKEENFINRKNIKYIPKDQIVKITRNCEIRWVKSCDRLF